MKVAHKRSLVLVSLAIVLYMNGLVAAQTVQVALDDVKQIKLLVSSRDDVRKILANYETTFDDDYDQSFSNDEVDIRVFYSSGTCAEEPEYGDYEDLWNVGGWKVTRIEIEPSEPVDPADIGFDLSRFSKQQRFRYSPETFVYHDKERGVALKSDSDGINEIIYFPRSAETKKLCGNNDLVKKFYSSDSWFPNAEFEYVCILVNKFADVVDVTLSLEEISASTSKTVAVTTTAIDPENDVLTYTYTISAGKIRGVGARVAWDLTGVPPGTYLISVGVNDGAGILGKTMSRSVVVK